jgi:peptidylprolyl isomerase
MNLTSFLKKNKVLLLFFVVLICPILVVGQNPPLTNKIKFKIKPSGIGVKFIKKNKKGELPKTTQRAFINYSLFHKKDTSALKSIIIKADKNFIIGSEEVLKGLEESLLMMKVGDSAVFKIPPHLAYGDKKVGNILPGSDLYFFVRLIKLEDEFFNHLNKDTTVFPDGLRKIIVKEGIGKKVQNFERVEINFTGYVYSLKGFRQIFESSKLKKSGFIFQISTGMLIPGLDEGILSMKVGEKATFIVPPSLGYGNKQVGKLMPNSTLYYDIELLNSTSPFLDIKGKAIKKLNDSVMVILVKDTSTSNATIEDLVQFDYMAYFKDKQGNPILFDNSFQNQNAMLVRPGSGLSFPGFDFALQQLSNYDEATIIVPYSVYKIQNKLDFIPDSMPIYYDVYVSNVSKYPFLQMNRTDTIKLNKGLKFIDEIIGMGDDVVKNGSIVKVAYTVYFIDNNGIRHIVDGTRENGKRIEINVGSGSSVKGLEEGLIGMKNTGSRRIIIPPDLAYGKEGVPQRGIPPSTTLIFDVEHLEILKK